ncbi:MULTISPECIES: non-hydrolyzing UDP-N-acetylglucosamine 2-epimerase [Thalassospira]|nr:MULTISPECIES: UDP-N-acetylglucosamine 2-epimerase (non-hydrolyzing) [Thalassospira]MDG4719837.1 UDP-N-acetylglucosamine 2-epimerase (non-hydrolyzing) [Thalassospira sp. FZY0004]
MKLHLIAGARPNFMKIAPLWRELHRHEVIRPSFIHMAQHRDDAMASMIWRELGLPDPDHILEWDRHGDEDVLGQMMDQYLDLCRLDRPDAVLVVGDVTASLAAGKVAYERGIPLIHLEAGLRCFDLSVPEERNRIEIDQMADLHLTPSQDADVNLLAEGIDSDRIRRVGNIMIDTLMMMGGAIKRDGILDRLELRGQDYVVVTLHRPGNVDTPDTLSSICQQLCEIARHIPVCLPLHPRTQQQLALGGQITVLEKAGIRLLPPLGYSAFGRLIRDAKLVITDSGGVQEETTWLGIPCLTLRPSTERPVTVTDGTNRLVRVSELASTAIDHVQRSRAETHPVCKIPLWDGKTASRVIRELDQFRLSEAFRK